MAHPGHYTLLQCHAYWTQCAIASYSSACGKKSTAQSEKKRLKSIAVDMLADLQANTPPGDEKALEDYHDCQKRLDRVEQQNIEDEATRAARTKLSEPPPKAL